MYNQILICFNSHHRVLIRNEIMTLNDIEEYKYYLEDTDKQILTRIILKGTQTGPNTDKGDAIMQNKLLSGENKPETDAPMLT